MVTETRLLVGAFFQFTSLHLVWKNLLIHKLVTEAIGTFFLHIPSIWIHIVADLTGGLVAGLTFLFQNPGDK